MTTYYTTDMVCAEVRGVHRVHTLHPFKKIISPKINNLMAAAHSADPYPQKYIIWTFPPYEPI